MSRAPVRGILIVVTAISLLSGCAAYDPRPLDESRLDRALGPPPHERLVLDAAALAHPRLAPIALDFSKPLTEAEVGIIAVLVSPALRALRHQEQVAAAQVFAAGLLPDPRLSGGLDSPIGAPAGVTGLVTAYNAALQWTVAALVTRPARVSIARDHARQVRLDVAWQEWLVANQARLLARRIALQTRQEALAREAAEAAAHLRDLTRENLERGDATITEFGVREVAFLDAQDRALALGRQLAATRQQLNRLLGLPPGETLSLAPPTFSLEPPPPASQLFGRARIQRLDLAALRAGYASQEARVYRAVLGQYPAVDLGLGSARDTGGVMTIGFNLSLDLPILTRNRGALALAKATRDQLYEEYVNRLHQTRADIATLVVDLHHVAREHAVLDRELPGLARAERVLRRAVRGGEATLLEYETVRATLLDKELQRLRLEEAGAEQRVALQIAVGDWLAP